MATKLIVSSLGFPADTPIKQKEVIETHGLLLVWSAHQVYHLQKGE